MSKDDQIDEIVRRLAGPAFGLWTPQRLHRGRTRTGARWVVAASRFYMTGSPATPAEVLEALKALHFPDVLYVLASLGLIATREPVGGPVYARVVPIFVSQKELRALVAAQQQDQAPQPDAINVFTRTGILLAIKLAIAVRDTRQQSSEDLTRIGSFLLDVNDFVTGARYRAGESVDADGDYKPLMIETLASWELNNPPELLHALGRVYSMLNDVAFTADTRVGTLVRALPRPLGNLEFDGVGLSDYIAIVFGIYSRLSTLNLDDVALGRVNTVIDSEAYLGQTKFPKERLDRFLANRSRDFSAIRDAINGSAPSEEGQTIERLLGDAEVADMTSLRRWPLIRLADGRILCLDLPFIAQLLTEGVFWTALKTYNDIKRSHGDTFLSLWGRLFELYGADLLRRCYPSESGLLTVDREYRTGQLDAVLDFGDYILLIEFKASLLPVAARCSRNSVTFEQQFRKKFVENERGEKKGVQQLADSVKATLAGDLQFAIDRPVIYPVLVCYEPSVDALWMNRYANEIFAQSVPGGLSERVRPLTLMSIEGLEMALPYVTSGDLTWRAILESRFSNGGVDERSVYQAIYDWRAANGIAKRTNTYLKERFDSIVKTVVARYRGEA